MSDLQSDDAAAAKNEKTVRTLRVLWTILLPVFALIVLYDLYEYSQGRDELRHALAPFGMLFVGAASLIRPRNKNLATVFVAIALVLVVGGLIAMFVYKMEV